MTAFVYVTSADLTCANPRSIPLSHRTRLFTPEEVLALAVKERYRGKKATGEGVPTCGGESDFQQKNE